MVELEPDLFDGCILYSPALSIDEVMERPTNKALIPFADCLARLMPTARLGSTSPNTVFPHEDEYIKHDPLCDRLAIRLWTGFQTLKFVPLTADEANKITLPLLIFHSVNDTTCEIAGSERCIELASSTDKELVRVKSKDSWHSLLVEPCRDEVVDLTIQWLLARS